MKASSRQAVETKRAKRAVASIPAADRSAQRTRATADRAGIARSAGRDTSAAHGATPAATAVLSLGPSGLQLEPSPTEATLATIAALWREYDELTRAEWHCSRATTIRAQMRALLRSER